MAQNLQHESSAQTSNPLLHALQVEDQLARQKEIAGILEEFDEDKAVTLLFDALLKSTNSDSRKRVVQELRRIGSPKAVELLGSIMTDDFDPEVKQAALQGLRTVGSERAIDLLLSVLRLDIFPNREAAQALGDFSSERVVDGLIEASRNPLFPVDAAISSLAEIGSDRAIEHVITMMCDLRDDTGSLYAMEALLRLGTDKAIDALVKAWTSPDSILRTRLSMNLSRLKHKHLIAPLCQRLQNKAFSSGDRLAAEDMLGIIGTENELPLLDSIGNDVTESEVVRWRALRAAERISYEELKRKGERERALEETRAFVAHEFRHVLTPLNAYAKMLDEALGKSETNKEKLLSLTARIRKQTNTAFDLVNQYLSYSRPLSPQFSQTDINDLLEHVLGEFGSELENRKVALRTQFAENGSAEVEKDSVAQVLRNVIANAIQAIDKDGSLVITNEATEDSVTITIHDTGRGIKPEHLPHIFSFGFTTKAGPQGAGFGLALSKRIIEAHNGSIVIASDGKRTGTDVVITLPRKQTEIKNGRQHLTPADR